MNKRDLIDAISGRLGDKKSATEALNAVLETIQSAVASRDKVAIIDVEGMIMNARTSGLFSSGDNPMSAFREKLDAAAQDPHVKAVVLRSDSPCGSALASALLWREEMRVREKKPRVVSIGGMAASGGYSMASAATSIS